MQPICTNQSSFLQFLGNSTHYGSAVNYFDFQTVQYKPLIDGNTDTSAFLTCFDDWWNLFLLFIGCVSFILVVMVTFGEIVCPRNKDIRKALNQKHTQQRQKNSERKISLSKQAENATSGFKMPHSTTFGGLRQAQPRPSSLPRGTSLQTSRPS